MASIQKLDREMNKKAKAQQKRQRKIERHQRHSRNPGATESISPLQTQEGAMTGDLRARWHRAAGDNSRKESTANDL